MSDNTYKTPLNNSLNIFADGKIDAANSMNGKSLPCSVVSVQGAMITVKFELKTTTTYTLPQVTVPLAGAEYIRYPIKEGDKGFVTSASASLSAMSGQGDNASSLVLQGNLSALVFIPFGNVDWSQVDIHAVTIYAPNGVVLRDSDSECIITLTPENITGHAKTTIALTAGTSITLQSDKTISIDATNPITITAPTINLNASSKINLNSDVSISGTLDAHDVNVSGVLTVT
jgi:hypothetical protein